MLEIKTKKELANEAFIFASSFELVRYRGNTYIPVDYQTLDMASVPSASRRVWMPLSRNDLQRIAAAQYSTVFASDAELRSFDFMVAQNATYIDDPRQVVLVRGEGGLSLLDEQGNLAEATGEFVPNYIQPVLQDDKSAAGEVLATIQDWVGGATEATSLLHHLATCLAPSYSAVKYVLLLGSGRNGKGLLIKMMQELFGIKNVSHVSRQYMAEMNPTITDLNGKLLNLVFDGSSDYIRDSGPEKTLVAGEPLAVRQLYESTPTVVQTNALFIEALNREPKSKDKSSALQKRLSRFWFNNVYDLDLAFEKKMLSPRMISGFLQLLIEHFVPEDELSEKLKPTAAAAQLQVEHQMHNSLALQFLMHLDTNGDLGVDGLIGMHVSELADQFKDWRLKQNDLGTWTEPDVQSLFQPVVVTERKSVYIPGVGSRKRRVVTALTNEATAFVDSLKEVEDEDILKHVVETDGSVQRK